MDRPLPSDLVAERAVLGACLLDREVIIGVRDIVAAADFYSEKHAWIYEAILDCLAARIPPDPVTVSSALRDRDRLDLVGGITELLELTDAVPTVIHADSYARVVAKHARRRDLIQFGGQITAAAYNEGDPEQLIARFAQELELHQRIVKDDDWKGRIHDGSDIWAKPYTPRPFIVEGILPVGITLLHALPKKRKSWLAKNICYAIAGGGKALGQLQAEQGEALYINLEMDEELLIERLRVMFPNESPPRGVKFFYEWPDLESGFFTRLENYVNDRPYTRLVVVDTLVRTYPDDAFNREGYRLDARLIEPFTKFNANRGLAIMLIHHSRKMGGGGDPILGATGSTGLTGSVDSVLELQVDGDETNRGKLTRSGRRMKDDTPLPLKWDVQIGSWAIDGSAKKLTPERMALLDALEEHGPLTPQKLSVLLDRPAHSIRRLCSDMYKAGQITNINGMYDVKEIDLSA